MATKLPNGIEIFKAGRRTDDAGNVHVITRADLVAAAAAYDPALSEAPLVVGHPESDRPAYGWVAGLHVTDTDTLTMDARQVEPQFAEMVGAGRFKKRSPSWYGPDHPRNPKPGVWYPKHVAFLGAVPPAIKGMKDIAFAEGSADGTVNFSESIDPPPNPQEPDMTTELQTQLAAANALVATEKARADQAEQALKDADNQRKADRRAANVNFAEAQVAAGRVLPPAKEMLVATLEALADAAPVDFSEGGDTKKLSPADWLKSQITAAKPVISFSEHAPGGAGSVTTVTAASSDAELDKAAKAYAAKHNVNYAQAMDKLCATFTS